MRRLLEGLTILVELLGEDDRGDMAASHDEIYLSGPPPEEIPPDKLQALENLGFFWDTSEESWHKFV